MGFILMVWYAIKRKQIKRTNHWSGRHTQMVILFPQGSKDMNPWIPAIIINIDVLDFV